VDRSLERNRAHDGEPQTNEEKQMTNAQMTQEQAEQNLIEAVKCLYGNGSIAATSSIVSVVKSTIAEIDAEVQAEIEAEEAAELAGRTPEQWAAEVTKLQESIKRQMTTGDKEELLDFLQSELAEAQAKAALKGFKFTLTVDMWVGATDEKDAQRILWEFIEYDIEESGGLVRNTSIEPDPENGFVSDNPYHLTHRRAARRG
jgi:hypothetical protein